MGNWSVGWYSEGFEKYRSWWESLEWGYANDKYFDPYAPIINADYVSRFPEFKYSAYDLYKGVDFIRYLRVYEKHPCVEMLVKLGLQGFTRSTTIVNLCEKDKGFRRWLYRNSEQLRNTYHYVNAVTSAYKKGLPLTVAQDIERIKKSLHDKEYAPIREAIKKDYLGFENYIKAQKISYYQYRDYARACLYLELDMSQQKNLYPKEFKKWHDIRIDQYATAEALKKAEREKEFAMQFSSVANKYISLERNAKEDYIAVIAKTPVELVKEGSSLNHCVGRMNYDRKMAREETLIFFIRKKNEPDTPLVTIEYSLKSKQVLQCYGDNDSNPAEDIHIFVYKKWLPYANKQLKKLTA
jgi:hypothetical protein